MALNPTVFRTRSLTAIVFVVVMLSGLLWNQWSFFILFSTIHFGCWIEYHKIVSKIDPGYQKISAVHKYGIMLAGWCLMLFFTNEAFKIGAIEPYRVQWWWPFVFLALVPLIDLLSTKKINLKAVGHSFLGVIYISLSCGLMIYLRTVGMVLVNNSYNDFFAFVLPCVLIFSIWINDTMAYVVGSLIGRTPLSSISPKKTWEGTAGGAILAVVVVAITTAGLDMDWKHCAIIAAIAAIAGTIGDLFESKLKRLAGVKD
ncbi:MAG: phosphatidate cytidylyltransferase, partial [Chitinophagaceae bacterium]|nr:phosphatidate cytidylyltransferase [Chitinophagaceae bacterium]